MSFSQAFFTKLGAKSQTGASKPQPKMKQYFHIHNLVINTVPYEGRDSLGRNPTRQELSQKVVNPKSSFYMCKRLVDGVPFEKLPNCLIRRVAYRMTNKKDERGRVIYNDPECKNYDQITTEFQCYRLLKRCIRAVRLVGLMHENSHSAEDKKLFYGMMRLSNKRAQGIKNMLFILEEMNEGSLKEQLDRISAKKQEPFSEHEILEYTCQIVEALKELRLRGVIHRDLRPENILFHNKQIKISDFDSAFIKGWSDYRHVRNGLLMKDTTPLQIMQLISQSDDRLKDMSSEQLWEVQQYADVYFLGVNIYSMVFSHPFESFNAGKILANLINIKKRTGFCTKLLDIMARCLEKDTHKRITLDEIMIQLGDLERQTYMKHSTYARCYLAHDPLNLYSFSSNQMEQKLAFEASDYVVFKHMVDPIDMEDDWQNLLRLATVNRNTKEYERILNETLAERYNESIWYGSAQSIWYGSASLKVLQAERRKLRGVIEEAMQRLQIKAFYYQLVYRMLCEVHTDKLAQAGSYFLQNVQSHLELLTNQVVVVVSFIYEMLLKGSFTEDPYFVAGTADYELRRVYDNSRVLFARRAFFAGRKHGVVNSFNLKDLTHKLQQYRRDNREASPEEVGQLEEGLSFVINNIKKIDRLEQLIEDFNDVEYDQHERNRYLQEYNNLTKFLDKIQKVLKSQMIQTIINLIISYEKTKITIRSTDNSLKNAIFMLMILEAQNTNHLNKNDIVAIKLELTKFINFRVGWKTEELEAFFANYTKTHADEVRQGLHELQSQAVLGGSPSMLNIEEEQEVKYQAQVEKQEYQLVVQHVSQHHHSTKEVKRSYPKALPKMQQHRTSLDPKPKEKAKEEASLQIQEHQPIIEDDDVPQIKIVDTTAAKKAESLEMSQAFEFRLEDNNSLIRQSIPVENFEDLDE